MLDILCWCCRYCRDADTSENEGYTCNVKRQCYGYTILHKSSL